MPVKQLRVVSTVLLAFAVGQAGLGSGYLDGGRWLLVAHAANAFAVLLLAILSAVFGLLIRRSGGPSWTFYFPLTLVGVVGIQMALGFAGVRGVHVFLGVLLTSAITMFCSYSWRLPAPHTGNDPRGGRKLTGSDQPAEGSTGTGVER